MLRALTLSLIIVATVATSLPVGESLVEAARRAVATRQSNRAHTRRRSRAWRRRYRAQLRRQRALAAARRRRRWTIRGRRTAVRVMPRITLPQMLKPLELPSASPSSVASMPLIVAEVDAPPPPLVVAPRPAPLMPNASSPMTAAPQLAHATRRDDATRTTESTKPGAAVTQPAPSFSLSPMPSPLARLTGAPRAGAPNNVREPRRFSALPVPGNWHNVSSGLGGDFKFSLRSADGRASGSAVWSRVNLPTNAAAADRRNKVLAGVAHASLRRTVIDRMVVEGGWVVNDFEREIGGQRVFVVVAQSVGSDRVRRNWTYYFVEPGGQLFSLATTAPSEFADSVAADAEQVVASIGARSRVAAGARN